MEEAVEYISKDKSLMNSGLATVMMKSGGCSPFLRKMVAFQILKRYFLPVFLKRPALHVIPALQIYIVNYRLIYGEDVLVLELLIKYYRATDNHEMSSCTFWSENSTTIL